MRLARLISLVSGSGALIVMMELRKLLALMLFFSEAGLRLPPGKFLATFSSVGLSVIRSV